MNHLALIVRKSLLAIAVIAESLGFPNPLVLPR